MGFPSHWNELRIQLQLAAGKAKDKKANNSILERRLYYFHLPFHQTPVLCFICRTAQTRALGNSSPDYPATNQKSIYIIDTETSHCWTAVHQANWITLRVNAWEPLGLVDMIRYTFELQSTLHSRKYGKAHCYIQCIIVSRFPEMPYVQRAHNKWYIHLPALAVSREDPPAGSRPGHCRLPGSPFLWPKCPPPASGAEPLPPVPGTALAGRYTWL